MKTAVIQFNAGHKKDDNCVRAYQFVQKAIKNKAEYILLPEVFVWRGVLTKANRRDIADTINGETLKPFRELARNHKVFILAGSIYEKIKGAAKTYNTSVLINPHGKTVAAYRKINMFDAVVGRKTVRETDNFHPGKRKVVAGVGDLHVGLSICYDLRFPSLYAHYAKAGADVMCVPSAFTHKTGLAHWKVLLRARAIETLSYVLAPNQIGTDKRGIKYFGHSMIVDPWGKVVAEASGEKEEIIYAKIDRNVIIKARKALPSIRG